MKFLYKILLLYFTVQCFSYGQSVPNYKLSVQRNNISTVKSVGDVDFEFLTDNNLYENYLFNYSIQFLKNMKVTYGQGGSNNIVGYSDYLITSVHVVDNPFFTIDKYFNYISFKSGNQLKSNNDFIDKIFSPGMYENFVRDSKINYSNIDVGLDDFELIEIKKSKYKTRNFVRLDFTGVLSNPSFSKNVTRQEYTCYYKNSLIRVTFEYFSEIYDEQIQSDIDFMMTSFNVDERINNNK